MFLLSFCHCFSVISLWLENVFCVILILSDLASFITQVTVYLGDHPRVLEKNVCCALVGGWSVL